MKCAREETCRSAVLAAVFLGVFVSNAVAQSDYDRLTTNPNSEDSYWFQLDSTQGIDFTVDQLVGFRGKLVVGGFFSRASTVPVNNLAIWDSFTWDSIGRGYPVAIGSLGVFQDNLYVGGSFGVQRWDGTSWSWIDFRMFPDGNYFAMTQFDTSLIVGGWFGNLGSGLLCNSLAAWSGTQWSALGQGVYSTNLNKPGQVFALTTFQGELIVGGFFNQAGGISAKNIAAWDGQSWRPLAQGIIGNVYALCEYQNNLYAAGQITKAGTTTANGIARWDGLGWSSVTTGLGGDVRTLFVHDNFLYCGGSFTSAGTVDAARVASWDGSVWRALGSGTSSPVSDLTEFDNQLWVGGVFTIAGGAESYHVAAWTRNASNCCSGISGNVDCDPAELCDISDLSSLIDHLYISMSALCCAKEANTDGSADGNIDISDLAALIDYLYITSTLPAVCQ